MVGSEKDEGVGVQGMGKQGNLANHLHLDMGQRMEVLREREGLGGL